MECECGVGWGGVMQEPLRLRSMPRPWQDMMAWASAPSAATLHRPPSCIQTSHPFLLGPTSSP